MWYHHEIAFYIYRIPSIFHHFTGKIIQFMFAIFFIIFLKECPDIWKAFLKVLSICNFEKQWILNLFYKNVFISIALKDEGWHIFQTLNIFAEKGMQIVVATIEAN